MEAQDITVIIPAYGRSPHLESCLRALCNNRLQAREIIVSHSGGYDPTGWLSRQYPEVRVLHSPSRLFAGTARNVGAESAKGKFLAFCDCDVLPSLDWLEEISKALKEHPESFIVGAVGMAESGGYWGTANWLCEFSEMAPWHPARKQNGGASCNMALRADHFRKVGGFDENLQFSEDTALFFKLRASGLEQRFQPSIIVGHFNHSGLSAFVRHQYNLGRGFPRARATYSLRGSRIVKYPVLALFAWLPKLVLISGRVLGGDTRGMFLLLVMMPALLLGCIVLSMGIFAGLRER